MTPEDLQRLIAQPEGLKVDFKRDFYKIADADYSPETPEQKRKDQRALQWGELLKDVLSLANGNVNTAAQSGYLIVGVEDESKRIHDVGRIDTTLLRKQLIQKIGDIAQPPLADINCETVEQEGKRLLVIIIPPSPYLHETTKDLQTPKRSYPKHTVFIRRGEEIGPASQAERLAIAADKERLLTAVRSCASAPNDAELGQPAPEERFAESITKWMAKLKRKVEWLTADQRQVLHQLRYRHRALITGCAGSGKTLLAAEKAIRLDAAGIRTLVLCHNPNLARYLNGLIGNPAIDVLDIATLVNSLNGIRQPAPTNWSGFDEPLEKDLDRAFDAAHSLSSHYDAVIVDEGQDFRDVWWILIDAVLERSSNKILYIFYDDNQALLPHRAQYPHDCHEISMSRNCRNAGNIFEIVRRLHRDAPITSSFLAQDGIAKISVFDEQDFRVRLEAALIDAYNYVDHHQIRVLTNETSAELSNINGFEFARHAEHRWRAVVGHHLHALREKALKRVVKLASGSSISEIANRFRIPLGQSAEHYLTVPALSQEKVPSVEDIRSVQAFGAKLLPFFGGHRNETVYFAVRNRQLYLAARAHTGKEVPVNDASSAYFYSLPQWPSTLPVGRTTQILANCTVGVDDSSIPLYSVDTFKGLECDALVLVISSASHNLLREMYVGASRAICYLNLVISKSVYSRLTSLSDLDARFII
jgi:hypothetical protein